MSLTRPDKIPFTKEGLDKIKKDFDDFSAERKQVLVRLQTAREMGDLSENGAYKAARFELSDIDRKLRKATYLLRFGEVREAKSSGTADFASLIEVESGGQRLVFSLVSGYESDPLKHKISIHSPLGKAIIGKKAGDEVMVSAPAGQISYTIISIKP